MRKYLSILLIISSLTTFASNDTTYFSSDRNLTLLSSKAQFYTLDSVKATGNITLFDIKTNQKHSNFNFTRKPVSEFLVAEGEAIYYYPNGNVQKKGVFKENLQNGNWQEFYESGKSKETIIYDLQPFGYGYMEKKLFNYKVIEFWDSFGKKSVENGNGLYFFRDSLATFTVDIKNGLADGTCGGTFRNYQYTEKYKKGEIQKGEISVEGKKIKYDKVFENAEYIGGIRAMYMFIGQNLKYPASAQRYNKQGKVFAKFLVGIDGSITNINILKGFYEPCEAETVRVLAEMSGNWQSAKIRGIKEKQWYTMPVSFVLE